MKRKPKWLLFICVIIVWFTSSVGFITSPVVSFMKSVKEDRLVVQKQKKGPYQYSNSKKEMKQLVDFPGMPTGSGLLISMVKNSVKEVNWPLTSKMSRV